MTRQGSDDNPAYLIEQTRSLFSTILISVAALLEVIAGPVLDYVCLVISATDGLLVAGFTSLPGFAIGIRPVDIVGDRVGVAG